MTEEIKTEDAKKAKAPDRMLACEQAIAALRGEVAALAARIPNPPPKRESEKEKEVPVSPYVQAFSESVEMSCVLTRDGRIRTGLSSKDEAKAVAYLKKFDMPVQRVTVQKARLN